MRVNLKVIATFVVSLVFLSCGDDSGLVEYYPTPALVGKIKFISKVPPVDSLKSMRIGASPFYPLYSTFDSILTQGILTGKIPVTSTLNLEGLDSGDVINFTFDLPPGEYKYIALLHQYGTNFLTDWQVISVYGSTKTIPNPKSLTLTQKGKIYDVDLIVDFKNLPPQPFKK